MTGIRYLWLSARVVIGAIFVSSHVSAGSGDVGARIDSSAYIVEVHGDKARIHEFRTITVVSQNGDAEGVVSARESSLLKLLSVTIAVEMGGASKPVKAGKKDMARYCGYGSHSAAYSEDCQYVYSPKVTSYPYTVTVQTEYEAKTLYMVAGDWRGCLPPISKMVVEVIGKTGDEFRWKIFGGGAVETVSSKAGQVTKRWAWSGESVSFPEKKEVLTMPPEDRPKIGVQLVPVTFVLGDGKFSNVDSWDDIALYYSTLSRNRYDHILPDPESLVSLPRYQRADAIYSDVITRSRYFSVDIGISGWQTQAASFTEKTLWADCKGLTTWLVSRARANGLTAFPALVLTREHGAKDSLFPDFRFNHVITMVTHGVDTQWYDPTCDDCPAGVLPVADQGILALVVTDSGGRLIRTPSVSFQQNRVERIIDVDLSQDGGMKMSARIESFGNLAVSARSAFRQSERVEWADIAKSYLEGDLEKRFTVDSVSVEGMDDIAGPFAFTFQMKSKRLIDRVGNTAFFLPFQFSGSDSWRDYLLDIRESRVDLGRPSQFFDSVTIHGSLIDGLDSVFLPPAKALDSIAVSLSTSFSRNGGVITATLRQSYRDFAVPAAELREFSLARSAIIQNRLKLWYTAI